MYDICEDCRYWISGVPGKCCRFPQETPKYMHDWCGEFREKTWRTVKPTHKPSDGNDLLNQGGDK